MVIQAQALLKLWLLIRSIIMRGDLPLVNLLLVAKRSFAVAVLRFSWPASRCLMKAKLG